MRTSLFMRLTSSVLAFLLVSSSASANAGLPMVAILVPPMWLALVPIIVIEATIMMRRAGVPIEKAFLAMSVGNVASTIIGIPAMWVFLAVIELTAAGMLPSLNSFWATVSAVTLQAPWLAPDRDNVHWMVPAALAALLVPCFLVSVAIEGLIARPFLQGLPSKDLWRNIVLANAASYVLLVILYAISLANEPLMLDLWSLFSGVIEWTVKLAVRVVMALRGQPGQS